MKYSYSFLRKLKSGDRKAYKSVFLDFYAPLSMFAKRYVLTEDASQDIAQEVLMQLWINHEKVNPNLALKPFLYTSVKNKSIDYLRKKDVYDRNIEQSFQSDSMDEHIMMSESVYANIHSAINTLPKRSKEIILLSMQELSNKEITDELLISINTVKDSKKRSYRNLRDRLGKLLIFF